jgi:hypothetical protein
MPSLSQWLVAALACHAAAPPAQKSPEATVSPTPLDLDAAKALAARYGETMLGVPAGTAATLFLGTASGYPEFTVYSAANPRRPGTNVVVRGTEVLAGESGFRTFVQGEGLRDPARLGAAYALLARNCPEEPGPGSTLSEGTLSLVAVDTRGNKSKITVRIAADGAVTPVSDVPE